METAWKLFEEATTEASIGELPGLMKGLMKAERPVVRRQVKVEVKEEEQEEETQEGGKVEGATAMEVQPSTSRGTTPDLKREDINSPVTERVGSRKYVYRCPYCEFPATTSKSAVVNHIRREHTKEALFCNWCDFSTYSPDYLGQHIKTHNIKKTEPKESKPPSDEWLTW